MSVSRCVVSTFTEVRCQGVHNFSWAVLPHEGTFLESDVPVAAYLFNSPIHGKFRPCRKVDSLIQRSCTARLVASDAITYPLLKTSPPFTVEGARNVFLETIKRGEDDEKTHGVTVILRLYEAYGGHARATLKIGGHIPVSTAHITNILEDELEYVQMARTSPEEGGLTSLTLDFHAFEVKTVKLHIGPPAQADERSG